MLQTRILLFDNEKFYKEETELIEGNTYNEESYLDEVNSMCKGRNTTIEMYSLPEFTLLVNNDELEVKNYWITFINYKTN